MTAEENNNSSRWLEAWPDALAFGAGLAVAWWAGWETTDLVWSLWLSSLLIGYAMIVWMIFGPMVSFGRKVAGDRTVTLNGRGIAIGALGGGAILIGGLFMLAFFTVHFGMFHFVHSMFLAMFFPLDGVKLRGMPGLGFYFEVFQRYWFFLPMAWIAERQAFRRPSGWSPPSPAATGVGAETDAHLDTSVTAEAIAARKARNAKNAFGGGGMMAPYKNVIRMHVLIFFFAFASFMKLESFLVYAVVYAAYFFPWRLLGKKSIPAA